MNIVLTDTAERDKLLPLVFTRPVALLRVGILTIKEKWEKRLSAEYSFKNTRLLVRKVSAGT